MNDVTSDTLAVIVERELPYPPARIWRALTQPELIAEWLMKNDFQPVRDHRFILQADWGSVACRVIAIEPGERLSYSWDANGLESVVTWTLTPVSTGTRLRMEHTGFRPDQQHFYHGAEGGWPRFADALEQVLSRLS
jgi:uncharacterized protein YndB with AHSA1/START domain